MAQRAVGEVDDGQLADCRGLQHPSQPCDFLPQSFHPHPGRCLDWSTLGAILEVLLEASRVVAGGTC